MQLLAIIAILIAIGGVAFALQNNVPVKVSLLVWSFESSLAMILLLALALGALIIALVSTPFALRSQWTITRQRREIEALRETNAVLETRLAATEPAPSAAPPPFLPPDHLGTY